jgi:hypothetical protein
VGVRMSLLERWERLLSSDVVVVVEGTSPSLIRPRGLVLCAVGVVAAAAAGDGGGTLSLAAEFKRLVVAPPPLLVARRQWQRRF